MKILFPQGGATESEIEEVLKFSVEGRKRVKDQLFRIDSTYAEVDFSYSDTSGKVTPVVTLEELEHPNYFNRTVMVDEGVLPDAVDVSAANATPSTIEPAQVISEPPEPVEDELKEGHITIAENQRGVSYDELFGPYLKGAKHITITDPYIRKFYQARNVMELLETIVRGKAAEDEVVVSLITVEDDFGGDQQRDFLTQIQSEMFTVGIKFAFSFDNSGSQHARHIVTDTDWKISLDRGLDVFQHYEMNDSFQLANRNQKYRSCRAFEVTYIKL
jgi:ATP-dependent Lon protease